METRYGHPKEDWEAAREQAHDLLVDCARSGRTVTYTGFCESVTAIRLKPYSFGIIGMLDEVCAADDERYGVILASLVVRKDTGMPGEGYFRHFERNGCDVSDREAFWRDEVEKVFAAFGG